MRKDIDKKKRNTFIIGGIIIALMVTSVLGIFGSFGDSSASKVEYNGYKFFLGNQGWFTRVNNQQIYFTYLPKDVENITLPSKINTDVEKIYLIKDEDVERKISVSLDKLKAVLFYLTPARLQDACLSEDNCNQNLPLVECNNPTQIIYFKLGDKTENYVNQSCIVLEVDIANMGNESSSTQEDINRLNERVIYDVLGIIR